MVRLPAASEIAGPDDPRSWPSWCEPWLGEQDGLRCVLIPEKSLNLGILALLGHDLELAPSGGRILRWERQRVAYEVHEVLSAPERFSEEHAALLRRLVSTEEWEQAEEMVRQIRENTTPEERDLAAGNARSVAEQIHRATRRAH